MNVSDANAAALECLMQYGWEHPRAADTLEGICQWWLGEASFSPQQVEAALQVLTKKGVMESVQAADGRVRYSFVDRGGAVN